VCVSVFEARTLSLLYNCSELCQHPRLLLLLWLRNRGLKTPLVFLGRVILARSLHIDKFARRGLLLMQAVRAANHPDRKQDSHIAGVALITRIVLLL
jgi:hypothetical protein